MLQRDEPEDFVLATGTSHSLEEFVSGIFAILGMDWKEHVRIENSFFRPSDISYSRGNPEKAREKLNWEANTQFPELLKKLIAAEIDRISR
jgi:GDPmannose 4,6-dehydratase